MLMTSPQLVSDQTESVTTIPLLQTSPVSPTAALESLETEQGCDEKKGYMFRLMNNKSHTKRSLL